MEKFYQYIENALPSKHGDSILYKFKKETLDSMFARANELTSRGLKDENVINDIIISEYSDVVEQYKAYENEKKLKRRRKRFLLGNIIGSVAYILTMVILYVGISLSTKDWGHTWVILADGALVHIAYLLALGVNRIMDLKRIFHFIARILLALDIMVIAVAVFIFAFAILHTPSSWLIIFGGLFSMFFCDALFASLTKQRLAIINWLVYVPVMSAMLYVILGAVHIVSWGMGWLIIPASVVLDLIIAFIAVARNNKTDEEVVDEWQES